METTLPGELVKIATGGPELDGIVFDVPSRSKVVVAVVDSRRGPVFRTVPAKSLSAREEEGADDNALQLLIRRTPPPSHDAARGGARGGGARPGHTRAAMHRPTGK
jgi:hypothetical protein